MALCEAYMIGGGGGGFTSYKERMSSHDFKALFKKSIFLRSESFPYFGGVPPPSSTIMGPEYGQFERLCSFVMAK